MNGRGETDVEGKSKESGSIEVYVSRNLRSNKDGTYDSINAVYSDKDKLAALIKAVNDAFAPQKTLTSKVTDSTLSQIVKGEPALPTFAPHVDQHGVSIDVTYAAPGMVYRYW